MQPIEILLVEDNLGDIRLTQEALKDSTLENNLSVVQDGVQALTFLRREGNFTGAPRPDIILLDLNLPRKDGREVLAEIKEDARLKRIPVVVLTTSDDDKDIMVSYNLHANCYITKPVDLNRFVDIIKTIEGFWFQVVKLPPA
jgi:CheY-like chemotaxis protein